MSQSLELKQVACLRGSVGGMPGAEGAVLVFPPDTTGIVVNRANTLNGGIEDPATVGADGSILDGIALESQGGTDTSKHGIWLRARATLRGVTVTGFPGDGIHIEASTQTDDPALIGNANGWSVDTVYVGQNGRHGFYVHGSDTNAGQALGINAIGNGGAGIYDSSFLGNTYIGCHASANIGPSYKTDNPNGRNVLIGCYEESGQVPAELSRLSVVIGGTLAEGGYPGSLRVNSDGHFETAALTFDDGYMEGAIGGNGPNGDVLRWRDKITESNDWRFKKNGTRYEVTHANLDARVAASLHSEGDATPFMFSFSRMGVGSWGDMVIMSADRAVPTVGYFPRGSFILNNGADETVLGWRCTRTGHAEAETNPALFSEVKIFEGTVV